MLRKILSTIERRTKNATSSCSRINRGWLNITLPLWLWKNPFNPFYKEKQDKKTFYWSLSTALDTIKEADRIFEKGEYFEVYQLLNRIKFRENVDIHWRICRVLYKMANDTNISIEIRKEMINEAYELIITTIPRGQNDPNVHKWMALVIDAKTTFEGTISKAKSLAIIKQHMEKAAELNPTDVLVLHMLGHLCYSLSRLTTFQRFLASYFFDNPPISNYEEAYQYFFKAEDVHSGFYIPNLYLLGKTCYRMKKYFRANYYLNMAASLPARSAYEFECSQNAKVLVHRLAEFDISRDALISHTVI